MAFPKPTAEAKAFFDALLTTVPDGRMKPMFGNFAAFINDLMFMGVFGEHVFLRLAEADRAALVAETGTGTFEPMAGRPMKEYILLPGAWAAHPELAHPWLGKSLTWTSALPPKKPPTKRLKTSPH